MGMTKIGIDDHAIAQALFSNWSAGMKADTEADWKYRWDRMMLRLDGMWDLVLWSESDCDETLEVREDIEFLRDVAKEMYYLYSPAAEEAA